MSKKIAGIFCLSTTAILLFALQGAVAVTSCTKTKTIIDTVTKIHSDTVIQIHKDTLKEQDTLLTTAILTANPWKLLELRTNNAGTFDYYLRGGTSNTQDFTNEYMTFNSNNTGTYTANNGTQTSFTWNFTDATNKKILWVINLGTPLTITWENILYDDGQLRYTEYYTFQNGGNVLSEGIRIPK